MEEFKCRICGHVKDNVFHKPKEVMFGTGEVFDYVECSACGCLQIKNYPEDMSQYYPDNYYSLDKRQDEKLGGLKAKLSKERTKYYLGEKDSLVGKFAYSYLGDTNALRWAKFAELKTNSKILDVGSGAGRLLLQLRDLGFTDLTGADPFISEDFEYDSVKIYKKNLDELKDKFDLIILNHSLEHMSDQQDVLEKVKGRLNDGGKVLIRIPVTGTYAWRRYGANWVSLDAPRHFYLHTVKSLDLLAENCGLKIFHTEFDSRAFQIYGSELCKANIPLTDERSYWVNKDSDFFTKDDLRGFKVKAKELNKENDGDCASFFLKSL